MEIPNNISTLKRPVLQRLCKAHNIKANLKNADMIALLSKLKESKDNGTESESRRSPLNQSDLSCQGNKENEPLSGSSPVVDNATNDTNDAVSRRKHTKGRRKKVDKKESKGSISEDHKALSDEDISHDLMDNQPETHASNDHTTSDTVEYDHVTKTHNIAEAGPLTTCAIDHMTSDTCHMTNEVMPTNGDHPDINVANDTSAPDVESVANMDTGTVTAGLHTDTKAMSTDTETPTEVMTTDTDTVTADADGVSTDRDIIAATGADNSHMHIPTDTDAMTTDTDPMTTDTDAMTTDTDAMAADTDLSADKNCDISNKQDSSTVVASEVSEEVKDKLNATFTIDTLEEDMEDAHAVLSESLSMTPVKSECANGSWASSVNKDRTTATTKESEANDNIIFTTPPKFPKLMDATAALPQSPLTTCVDYKSEMMNLINKRVEDRMNDPNYKPPNRDATASKIPIKASVTSKFDKAHEKSFKKMQSIDQVANRKRQREEHQQEGDKTAKKSKVQCSSRITELATPKYVNRRKTFNVTESTKKSFASKPFKKL